MKTEKKEKAVMVLGILKSVVTFFIKMFGGKKRPMGHFAWWNRS